MRLKSCLQKNKALLVIVTCTLLVLVSCKKDRTCTCVVTHGTHYTNAFWNDHYTSSTQVTTYKNITKSRAKDLCISSDESEQTPDTVYYSVSYDCTLK